MNELTIRRDDLIKAITKNSVEDILKPLTKEVHLGEFIICNLFKDAVTVVSGLKKGQVLALKKEISSEDFNVFAETTNGKRVGELDYPENKIFAKLLDAGKKLSAKVNYSIVLPEYNAVKIDVYLIDF